MVEIFKLIFFYLIKMLYICCYKYVLFLIMDKIIKILTEIESSSSGVYRKFMTTDEIKICNKLVKDDMLYKGKPDEKNATISFYITDKGSKWLENQK